MAQLREALVNPLKPQWLDMEAAVNDAYANMITSVVLIAIGVVVFIGL